MIYHLKKHPIEAYIKKVAEEFISKKDRILSLTEHDPTIGGWREEILRNFLEEHISDRFGVGTGFIYNSSTGQTSKQCDIIIYDKLSTHPFYFRDKKLIVVPPEIVFGVIEVKSELNHTSLKEAFHNIENIKKLSTNPDRISGYVFAFSSIWDTPYDFAKALWKWTERVNQDYIPNLILGLSKNLAWAFKDDTIGRHYILQNVLPWNQAENTMAFFWGVLNTAIAVWTGELNNQHIEPQEYIRRFTDFDREDRLWLESKIVVGSGLTPAEEITLKLGNTNYFSRQALEYNNIKRAIQYARKGLTISDNSYSRFNLSQALFCKGDFRQALVEIEQANTLTPNSLLTNKQKAIVNFILEDYTNAFSSISEAINLASEDKIALEELSTWKYRIMLQQGRASEVLQLFDQEIPTPIDPSSRIWKAVALLDTGQAPEGKKILNEIAKLLDVRAFRENYESKAIISIKLNKKTQAKNIIEEYINLAPQVKKIICSLPEFSDLDLASFIE